MSTPVTDNEIGEMRAEYDFSGGVHGKYATKLREEGYVIREYDADGTFSDTQVLGAMTVVLAPDVWEYFPDSQAVNHALRTLISLIPSKHPAATKETRTVAAARR